MYKNDGFKIFAVPLETSAAACLAGEALARGAEPSPAGLVVGQPEARPVGQ